MDIVVQNVTYDLKGFEQLCSIERRAAHLLGASVPVRLDLSGVTWLAAPMCASLGALIAHLRSLGSVAVALPRREAPRRLLERNGFAAAFGGGRLPDYYRSTIDYEMQPIDDEVATREYLRTRLLDRPELARFSSGMRRRIEHAFGEIRENAREHGKTRVLHVCGQLFPNRHELAIQIVDLGIGFQACINARHRTGWSATECLEWAMAEGSTTRTGDRPGGLGLKELRAFLSQTGGSLRIVSGDGAWSLTGDHVIAQALTHPLSLTAVSVTFNTLADEPADAFGEDDAAEFF